MPGTGGKCAPYGGHEEEETHGKERPLASNPVADPAAYQRPDHHGEHLIMYSRAFPYADTVYIENNLFDLCDAWICRWEFTTTYAEDTNPETRKKVNGVVTPIDNAYKNGKWVIRNNTYYHGKNKTGGINWYGGQKTGSGQASLETIIKQFDQSPAKIVWVY